MKETKNGQAGVQEPHEVMPGDIRRLQGLERGMVSFTELFLDKKVFDHIKLPPWLFPVTYPRKDQSCLTDTEKERFLCALNTLIANGTFGKLVDIHAEPHMMHGSQRFLPWHRIYLLKLEAALKAVHPDVSLPYWDWSKSSQQEIPGWLSGVLPTVVTPTRTIPVNRSPGNPADLNMIASNLPATLANSAFGPFTATLEGLHGAVHVWVGGTMSFIATAPADPIFWMHHANIDRLWAEWQASPRGTGKNPALSGAQAVMDPWTYTEADTRSLAALGYFYE